MPFLVTDDKNQFDWSKYVVCWRINTASNLALIYKHDELATVCRIADNNIRT